MTELWNMPPGQKVKVQFNDMHQGVGPEARTLASYLGTVARNCQLLPLNIQDWRRIPASEKERILELVKVRLHYCLHILSHYFLRAQ